MRYVRDVADFFLCYCWSFGGGCSAPGMQRYGEEKLIPTQKKNRPNMTHTCRGAWRIRNIQGISSFYDFRTSKSTGFVEHLSIGRKVLGVPFFLEPTIQLGMSQQGLTMLVVWDGFGHELIPLFFFSFYPFKHVHH
jgi:hypothetical protein